MRYSIRQLESDVMARLGEIARPHGASVESGVPWPEDVVAVKARSLLGDVGSELIRGAAVESLGGQVGGFPDCEVAMRKMPCGLYGAEVRLPGGFLRFVSVKMSAWSRSVSTLALPESPSWSRQWSPEPGIAGCRERPRAYLDSDGEGLLLRLLGSESSGDVLEWLHVRTVPEVDDDGEFDFPEALYGRLAGEISRRVWQSDLP